MSLLERLADRYEQQAESLADDHYDPITEEWDDPWRGGEYEMLRYVARDLRRETKARSDGFRVEDGPPGVESEDAM